MKWKWVVIGIIFVLVVILLIQNQQVVVYRFFFWQLAISQVILVPVLVAMGFVAGFITALLVKKRPKQRQKVVTS